MELPLEFMQMGKNDNDEYQVLIPFQLFSREHKRSMTWPRSKKNEDDTAAMNVLVEPDLECLVTEDVIRVHETHPNAWTSEEGSGQRQQAWKIVTMVTRLLVATGAARKMDRFVPSSKQPHHWSRNYNGPQNRRKADGRRPGTPDSKRSNVGSCKQGVTLRAEDLVCEKEAKFGNGVSRKFLSPTSGDKRAGGSATELSQNDRVPAPLRRSSEGAYMTRRRKSSSSSNAADDPTSSDPSSSYSASSSSSSESGCNGDSETCSYCRLSESSDTYEYLDSTDDERSSSSVEGVKKNSVRLIRAHSDDCRPPSKPIRRSSPGEYLRHKRHQMERLGNFKKYDSDPRLYKRRTKKECSPNRTSTFASPTKNRSRQRRDVDCSHRKCTERSDCRGRRSRRQSLKASHCNMSLESLQWNSVDGSYPFLDCGGAIYRCTVCCNGIPFANCVLCEAESRGKLLNGIHGLEFPVPQQVQTRQSREVDLEHRKDPPLEEQEVFASAEDKKDLEEFYDGPTPANSPPPEQSKESTTSKIEWTSNASAHKSFNYEETQSSKRKTAQLRKYHSEPAPEPSECSSAASKTQSKTAPVSRSSRDSSRSRTDSSCSSSSQKSDKRAAFHVAKDSPKRGYSEEESASSCQSFSKSTEDEDSKAKLKFRTSSLDVTAQEKSSRKSPTFLKPEFEILEPDILHTANPDVDEAETEVLSSAKGAFRRLSEEEFVSTLNIHEAARKGDLHVVKLLTKKDSKQMETVDERGWTPIHLAAAHGHSEVVKYLAMEGAHLAALDPSHYSAMHLSSMNGHNSILEVLLPMGVDVDSVTAEGFTALHLAVMNGHLECIQTLLQWRASTEKRDSLGRGVYEMVEEYNLEDVAGLLRKYHKKMHNMKHVLDMIQKNEDPNNTDIPQEYIDILASIAEESGTE